MPAFVSALHPDDRERVVAAIDCHVKGVAPYDVEYRIRRADGSYAVWTARGTAIRDASGKPVRWVGAITDVTERKRAEAALRDSHGQVRALAARLSEVDEAERQRLARELHDQVGQSLTALGINLNFARGRLPADTSGEISQRLDEALEQVEQTAERIRGVMSDLRPAVLDDYGLAAALRWYGEQYAQRTRIAVDVLAQDLTTPLSPEAQTALFRITQEALTNVAKHAHVAHVDLILEETPAAVRLTIADDGVGFDTRIARDQKRRAGWGLLIMRERATAVGGNLLVESTPGRGTRVVVEVGR